MSDAIRAAFDRERRAKEEHHAASLALSEAVAAYRAEHPAPAGQYWRLAYYPDETRGTMVLRDAPAECTHAYGDGTLCGGGALAWDDAGNAWCDEHREKQ
jgi:hypothetical protein